MDAKINKTAGIKERPDFSSMGFEVSLSLKLNNDLRKRRCLHKHSLCYSMNFLFFPNLSRKYCCDAIVAIKCVHFDPASK